MANGCLLPAWASAVLAGDDRWGEAGRLCTAWEALAGAVGCTESDPARGLAAVVDRWAGPQPDFPGDLPGDLPGDIAGDVGERAAMRWGTVLGRFRAAEIADVVRLALWAPTRYLAGPSTETSVSSASSGAPRPLTR